MNRIPKTPDDFFHWKSGKSDFQQALQFLIDTRNYVANLDVPDGKHYVQIAHSGDTKAVGGNRHRPAVLDASYEYFGRHLLSISLPIWTPANNPIRFYQRPMTWREAFTKLVKPDTKINLERYEINTGFTGTNLQEAFLKVLDYYGIQHRDPKVGYYEPEGTSYIETSLINSADFDKGQKIIQAYVHGNAQSPQQLQAEIERALGITPRPTPKGLSGPA